MITFIEIEENYWIKSSDIKLIIDNSHKNNKFNDMLKRCRDNDKMRSAILEERKNLKGTKYEDNSPLPYKKRYFDHTFKKTMSGKYRYVITKDDEVHKTTLTLDELKARLTEGKVKFIDMSEFAIVALSYISGVANVDKDYVSSSVRCFNAETANLQFVSGGVNKARTLLWLKTGEIIRLSRDTREILAQIEELEVCE